MSHRRAVIPIMLILMAITACTGTVPVSALLITGDLLDATGAQYVETGKLYDRMFLAKKVTPGEYRAWAKFAEDFPVIYRQAVEAWSAGSTSGPKAEAFIGIKNALRDHFIFANERNK